jgi:hypothetical protein
MDFGGLAMPLRDHFRPPLSNHRSWEGVHGGWPMVIVQHLVPLLPAGFVAEPRVRLGAICEVDVGTFEDELAAPGGAATGGSGGGTATLTEPALAPTWTVEADLSQPDEYEVRVYDERDGGPRLVAAIEIVSPSNKYRPEARAAFAAKAAALLRRGVCVAVVDPVTARHFNLYAETLDRLGLADPAVGADPPAAYAATCRGRPAGRRTFLDTWFYPLAVGQPLPAVPLWLDAQAHLMVDLEASYEETCRTLLIR